MNDQFIPYEQALQLKELGFNEECFRAYFKYTGTLGEKIKLLSPEYPIYNNNFLFKNSLDIFKDSSVSGNGDGVKCSAPLWQQAFDWFIDKYGLLSVLDITIDSEWFYSIYDLKAKRNSEVTTEEKYFVSYEEARLARLCSLIEIAGNQSLK